MAIGKICILGLEDYAMLTGNGAFGYVNGESVQHVLLARAWRDLGLDVSIVVYDHGQPRTTMIDGIRAIAAYPRQGGIRVLRFLHPRLTSVMRAMREIDADVYYQSPAAPWSGVVAYFAKRFRKRSILRIASDTACRRGEAPERHRRQPVTYRRDRWMFDYGVLNASLVAAQTEHQRELLARNYGIHSETVNIAGEFPTGPRAQDKDVDVLWVGNMRAVKRPDIALELARRLPRRRFAFVGGGVPGGEEYFERIAGAARALPNVTFAGSVSYQVANSWFDRARLHVNTSDQEGFPNTFLQAWIRRVPVVSFCDPDGLIERRGLGRRCRNIDEMEAALEQLLRNPAEAADIGARAHLFAASEFSAPHIATRYLDLLESQAFALVGAEARAPMRSARNLPT
jgi:glycosyltransferase involved in cell wall biosynthesis